MPLTKQEDAAIEAQRFAAQQSAYTREALTMDGTPEVVAMFQWEDGAHYATARSAYQQWRAAGCP